MKHFLIAWMCVVLASPAGWARQERRQTSDAESDGARTPVADVLVAIDIDASPIIFHDLTSRYVDALTAAGAATIATAATEFTGGSINFPPDLTADNYPVVVVLGSDNFFGGPNNIDANDEAALAAYLDSGGNLLLVGQDYMSGAHPDMNAPNPCYGFPRDYLGLDMCYQDFDTPPMSRAGGVSDPRSEEAMLFGRVAWVLVAVVTLLVAAQCFPNFPFFFTDRATPTRSAGIGADYEGQFASGDGVIIFNQGRGFRTVWSGVELAGADTDDFNDIIGRIYGWLTEETPVERGTWTAIKAGYR